MKYRCGLLSLCAASVLLTAFIWMICASGVPTAEAKDVWTSVRTRNFTFIGNIGERELQRFALQLEQFQAAFARLFTRAQMQLPAPTRVVIFRSDAAFHPFKPLLDGRPMVVTGFIRSASDLNYIALAADAPGGDPYAVVHHEFVHALIRNNTRRVPLWFGEGLAEYYSTFELAGDGSRVLLGKPIPGHVYTLRERPLLPLETFLAVDFNSPHYNEGDQKGVFYAQSWALVHYFMQGGERARRESFVRFVDLVSAGTPVEASLKQAFNIDLPTLEQHLKGYISRRNYVYETVHLGERLSVDAGMQTAQLAEAEVEYYLGDLLRHTERYDEAEAYLKRAIALDENMAAARASLGVVRARQRRFEEARKLLASASAKDSDAADPLIHYYYAWAVSREYTSPENAVSSFPPEAVRLMRGELRKAVELAPEYAEAHRLLAFVNLIANENLREAEALLRRAQTLAPGEAEYDYLLARALLQQERFSEAREALTSLVRGDVSPGLTARARELIAIIDQHESETKERERGRRGN
ncbi:MAG: tetratricopeptide repeat protein [Blastocatellales bacterium]|nr:tetratricopeptide repeat protein [Blastocatellales bacterium]